MRPTVHRRMYRYSFITRLTIRMFISTLIYIRTIATFLFVYHPGCRRIVKELRIKLLISNRHFKCCIINLAHFNFQLTIPPTVS